MYPASLRCNFATSLSSKSIAPVANNSFSCLTCNNKSSFAFLSTTQLPLTIIPITTSEKCQGCLFECRLLFDRFSDLGLSCVIMTLSQFTASAINFRLPRSRSPPQPNKHNKRPFLLSILSRAVLKLIVSYRVCEHNQ